MFLLYGNKGVFENIQIFVSKFCCFLLKVNIK